MKKSLLFLMVLLASLSVRAQNVINTVTSYETVTKNSTVYVGEVVVDGQSVIKYLYSGDVTINSIVLQNLLAGLQGMADVDYATLLEQELYYITPNQDFALCADAELAAAMDENWISASYVGALYYPGLTVKTEINSNLYDLDEGFKAVVDEQIADRVATIDYPIDAEKCIVSHLGANATENVYYTVEDGQVIKHVDTQVYYSCEATTVIYTKVELEATVTGVEDINAAQPKIGQRYNMMGQPVGQDYKGIVIEDGKKRVIK